MTTPSETLSRAIRQSKPTLSRRHRRYGCCGTDMPSWCKASTRAPAAGPRNVGGPRCAVLAGPADVPARVRRASSGFEIWQEATLRFVTPVLLAIFSVSLSRLDMGGSAAAVPCSVLLPIASVMMKPNHRAIHYKRRQRLLRHPVRGARRGRRDLHRRLRLIGETRDQASALHFSALSCLGGTASTQEFFMDSILPTIMHQQHHLVHERYDYAMRRHNQSP